ncbi:MAG TPA: hypothetical protein VGK67_27180 [Myxococcales bacterium]|jgi:hypothetical protein
MTAWRRATRWLMLALACVALGTSAVPLRAQAQVDVAAQVELAARKARKVQQVRSSRAPAGRPHPPPRALLVAAQAQRRRNFPCQRPAPPGRLYLTHRALLR